MTPRARFFLALATDHRVTAVSVTARVLANVEMVVDVPRDGTPARFFSWFAGQSHQETHAKVAELCETHAITWAELDHINTTPRIVVTREMP